MSCHLSKLVEQTMLASYNVLIVNIKNNSSVFKS